MSDKYKRVNAAGRVPETTLKRKQPYIKDDKSAREARRRASSYGRARGEI